MSQATFQWDDALLLDSQLTDDDIYTYVTLTDCELPIRKGPLTPINEGYANATGANRTEKCASLVRDIEGERPSAAAQARELWLQTEILWTRFPDFIRALCAAASSRSGA